jgi:DNA-binding beta-propeller fold protein YncE
MKRDPGTGAITDVGCISSDGTDGRDGASGACEVSSGLLGADGIAVSPDGTLVFVSASMSGSVVAFSRNAETGALTRLGCFQSRPPVGSTCLASNTFLGAGSLAVSADGKALYVASPRTGSISSLTASAGESSLAGLFGQVGPKEYFANPCIAVNGLDGGCQVGVAISGLADLTLSPDGQQLYGVAPGSGAIDVFSHDAAGVLTETGCLMASAPPGLCHTSKLLGSPTALALSPDGTNAYVTDDSEGRVIALTRNATTGALSDSSCLDNLPEESSQNEGEEEEGEKGASEEPSAPDPCTSVPGLSAINSVSVSGDGSAVYAIGSGSAVVLSRDPSTGALKEVSCAADEDNRCTSFPDVDFTGGTAISPDGHDVYVTAPGDDAVFVLGIGATVQTGSASATRAGVADVSVYCPRALARSCSGHLALTRAVAARAATARRHRRVVRVTGGTSAHYAIAPGHRAEIAVRLTPALRRLLVSHRRLHLMTVVHADPLTGGSGDGRVLRLTLR